MTLLYSDSIYLEHDTGAHPECGERLRQITARITADGLADRCTRGEVHPISATRLSRVHPTDYARGIEALCDAGGGRVDSDTVVSARSFEAATHASGAVADAVTRVVQGDDATALCLVRPPGHHALAKTAMGFCLFNHVAVGARVAITECELDRVLIVDWDVHHGNGTQAIFWEDEQVGFLSIHRWPFYPGTGAEDETGAGRGLGTIKNLPTQFGITRQDYVNKFTAGLEDFAAQIRPELMILSAGFDSHRMDPIGSLGLESEDFQILTQAVMQVANAHAGGKLVSVLEGGYHTTALAESVAIHLRELLASSSQ